VKFRSETKGCVKFRYETKGYAKFRSETKGCVKFRYETKGRVKFRYETKGRVKFRSETKGCVKLRSETKECVRQLHSDPPAAGDVWAVTQHSATVSRGCFARERRGEKGIPQSGGGGKAENRTCTRIR
jgi:hypothetical protein